MFSVQQLYISLFKENNLRLTTVSLRFCLVTFLFLLPFSKVNFSSLNCSLVHAPGSNIENSVKLMLKIVQTILYPLPLAIFLPLLNSRMTDSRKVLLSQAYPTFYSVVHYQYCKKLNTLHVASQNCPPFFRFGGFGGVFSISYLSTLF